MKRLYAIISLILLIMSIMGFSFYLYILFSGQVTGALLRLCLLIFSSLLLLTSALLSSRFLQRALSDRLIRCAFIFLFVIYAVFLFTLVLLDPYFSRSVKYESLGEHILNTTNLLPFYTIISFFGDLFRGLVSFKAFAVNIFGNLLAFAPFGFFLPHIFSRLKRRKYFLITILFIILSVEVLQLLTRTGSFDTDDLILNSLGAYIVFKIYNRFYTDRQIKQAKGE